MSSVPVQPTMVDKLQRQNERYLKLLAMLPYAGENIELVAEEMRAVNEDMRRIFAEATR